MDYQVFLEKNDGPLWEHTRWGRGRGQSLMRTPRRRRTEGLRVRAAPGYGMTAVGTEQRSCS